MLPITITLQARLQQRGIPPVVVESLLDFGRQPMIIEEGRSSSSTIKL